MDFLNQVPDCDTEQAIKNAWNVVRDCSYVSYICLTIVFVVLFITLIRRKANWVSIMLCLSIIATCAIKSYRFSPVAEDKQRAMLGDDGYINYRDCNN